MPDPVAIEPVARPSPSPTATRPAALRLQARRTESLPESRRARLPLGLDRRQSTRRQQTARCGHADEIAVVDDDHARHGLGRAEVDRLPSVAPNDGGRSTLPCSMPGSLMSEAY